MKSSGMSSTPLRRIEQIKQNGEPVGNRTRIRVVKNKIAPPFKTAEFDIMYGEGVSRLGTLIDMGVELEIVDKSGAWYSYEGTRLGQGKEKAKVELEANPAMVEEIERKVREKLVSDAEALEKAAPTEAGDDMDEE